MLTHTHAALHQFRSKRFTESYPTCGPSRSAPLPKCVTFDVSDFRDARVASSMRDAACKIRDLRRKFRDLSLPLISSLEHSWADHMSEFHYTAPAELFAARGRSGLRYRRFLRAADAIRYAVEKLPADVLLSARLEVEQKRYDANQIRALYDSANFRKL